MQQLSCLLCVALLIRCSAHFQTKPVKNLKEAGHDIGSTKTPTALLQLMDASLDTWGSAHVEANFKPAGHHAEAPKHKPHNLPSQQSVETPRLPLLSLMSLSLDNWGCNGTAESPPESFIDNVGNPLAQDYPGQSSQFLFSPAGFPRHVMSFALEPIVGNRVVNIFAVIFILMVLLFFICCFLCLEASPPIEDDDPQSPSLSEQQDFGTYDFDGSWAQVYREARGEQKEALELLFRCNIISTDEFAFSSVSPEHISECIWIATHMLRQKPLEEWVALWQQAQQTFEDSVTACFEARGSLPASSSSLPGSSTSLPASSANLGADRAASRLSPSICEDADEDDPYTARSHYKEASGSQEPVRAPPATSQSESSQSHSEQSHGSIENELKKGLAPKEPK